MKNSDKKISMKKMKLLSRFLDDDLSNSERASFIKSLETDRDLNAELLALKQFKNLLSLAPQVKSPKSFRITQSMVNIPSVMGIVSKGWRIMSNLSYAAMLIVVASQVLIMRNPTSLSSSDEMNVAVMDVDMAEESVDEAIAESAPVAMNDSVSDNSAGDDQSFESDDVYQDVDSNNVELGESFEAEDRSGNENADGELKTTIESETVLLPEPVTANTNKYAYLAFGLFLIFAFITSKIAKKLKI